MIKVEVFEQTNGVRVLYFTSNNPSDRDDLDKILEGLVGIFPRKGAFVPTGLMVEIKIAENSEKLV